MKEKTFEEFISEYVENKVKSNTKESYSEWVKRNGIDADEIYFDTLSGIEADYKRDLSTHGTDAERLSRLGLTGSGYSDYLSGKAYSALQESKLRAKESYAENTAKNEQGYQSRLAENKKQETELFESVINAISTDRILDYDTAYSYAVSRGLSKESAAAAARLSGEYTRYSLKSSVMNTIVSYRLSGKQALNYALGLGLSEEDAEELSKYAEAMNTYYQKVD